jgi:hypothetical protein
MNTFSFSSKKESSPEKTMLLLASDLSHPSENTYSRPLGYICSFSLSMSHPYYSTGIKICFHQLNDTTGLAFCDSLLVVATSQYSGEK